MLVSNTNILSFCLCKLRNLAENQKQNGRFSWFFAHFSSKKGLFYLGIIGIVGKVT